MIDVAISEQERFSARLAEALTNAGIDSTSPTALAREFNVRFPDIAVTVHAARKWLKGEAIPTQEKVMALASWLGVSAEWLRYDGDEVPVQTHGDQPLTLDELHLLRNVRSLDPDSRALVALMAKILSRIIPNA